MARGDGVKVQMNHQGNLGYALDQIDHPMTLGELLELVQDAVDEWGEDAQVVMHQTNNGYGANYGALARYELFEAGVEMCEACEEAEARDNGLCDDCNDEA